MWIRCLPGVPLLAITHPWLGPHTLEQRCTKLTWEASLSDQLLFGQHFHCVISIVIFIVGQLDNTIGALSNFILQGVLIQLHAVLQTGNGDVV